MRQKDKQSLETMMHAWSIVKEKQKESTLGKKQGGFGSQRSILRSRRGDSNSSDNRNVLRRDASTDKTDADSVWRFRMSPPICSGCFSDINRGKHKKGYVECKVYSLNEFHLDTSSKQNFPLDTMAIPFGYHPNSVRMPIQLFSRITGCLM